MYNEAGTFLENADGTYRNVLVDRLLDRRRRVCDYGPGSTIFIKKEINPYYCSNGTFSLSRGRV